MKLEDYCCICGCHLRRQKYIIGQREINVTIPAFACMFCVKDAKKHLTADRYYSIARPCDAEEWQDEDRIYIEVERVYATRIDCMAAPERVRQAA